MCGFGVGNVFVLLPLEHVDELLSEVRVQLVDLFRRGCQVLCNLDRLSHWNR